MTIQEYCHRCDRDTEQEREVIYGVTITTCMSCVEQPTFSEPTELVIGLDEHSDLL